MNLPALYQLTEQFRSLVLLSDLEGDDDGHALEAITTTLDALKGDIEVKAAGVGAYVLNLEAWSTAAAEASKKLAVRGKRIKARADALREYLRVHMAAVGVKKIEAPEFTLTRKANPPTAVIDPNAELPEEYLQERNPIVGAIVRAATSLCEHRKLDGAGEHLVLHPDELTALIEFHLPAREPDKKKIAVVLKAARDAHEAAVDLAHKTKQPEPPPPASVIPGCRLEQGERLEIKP